MFKKLIYVFCFHYKCILENFSIWKYFGFLKLTFIVLLLFALEQMVK